jgi:uncharacterized protein YkwD
MVTTSWLFLFCGIFLLNGCKEDNLIINNPVKIDKQLVLELVNNYRQNGCQCGSDYLPPTSPVERNELLENAAQLHTDDMKENDFFSHTGSDGSTVGDRVSSFGYTWSRLGENIANGYESEKDVVNGWINSEFHCKNIMNPEFVEMGVANNGIYWTQVFGKH